MGMGEDRIRKGLIALVAISLLLCPMAVGNSANHFSAFADSSWIQITFEPSIAPAGFHTEEPEYVATMMFAAGVVSIDEGAFYSPSYSRVDCGAIDAEVCFELCYAGACCVKSADDDRVRRFVGMVDERGSLIDALEVARLQGNASLWDTIGTCVKSIGGGLGLAGTILGIIAAVEPTQIVKTLAIIGATLSVLGGGTICGGSIGGNLADNLSQDQIIDDIYQVSDEAIFEFKSLQCGS